MEKRATPYLGLQDSLVPSLYMKFPRGVVWCGVVGNWVLDWIHQAPLQDIDYATMIVMS